MTLKVNDKVLVLDKRGIVTGIGEVLTYPEVDAEGNANPSFAVLRCKDQEFRMHIDRLVFADDMKSYMERELKRWLHKLLPVSYYTKHLKSTLDFYTDAHHNDLIEADFKVVDAVNAVVKKLR